MPLIRRTAWLYVTTRRHHRQAINGFSRNPHQMTSAFNGADDDLQRSQTDSLEQFGGSFGGR